MQLKDVLTAMIPLFAPIVMMVSTSNHRTIHANCVWAGANTAIHLQYAHSVKVDFTCKRTLVWDVATSRQGVLLAFLPRA